MLQVDLDLIRRYDTPGPRYTSYPTAPHLSDTVRWGDLKPYIAENNQNDDAPISLYFHLPFCRSLCWFCGCTNVITQDDSSSAEYLEYLHKELEMTSALINSKRPVTQLHFGGGSPTFLQPDEIRRLGQWIHETFPFASKYEAGVEIDPRTATEEKMEAFAEIGFNRISIGIQDINPEVQQAVHRVQPHEMNLRTIDWARSNGIQSVNIDLIYGLPKQTVSSFEKTIDTVLKMHPNRFAIFNYAHVPWIKKAQNALTPLHPEEKLALLKMTIEKLTSEGYVYIGMDHFALENDELTIAQHNKTLQRNFQGYSTHADADIYAFGMSSISQTKDIYWQNRKDLKEYYQAIQDGQPPQIKGYILSADDKIRRHTIMRLMCDLALDYDAIGKQLQIPFKDYFAEEIAALQPFAEDGLINLNNSGFTVTEVGRLLIRNIAMTFDYYIAQDRKTRTFSRTI